MTTAITEDQPASRHDYVRIRAWIRIWLWTVASLIIAMIIVGGITRLSHAGLSITDWQLIHGVIPPLSAADWQEEFARYQQIPEYQQLNQGMTLDEFQGIFWWEWTHRMLGRIIGLAVVLPFAFLWATGRLERILLPRFLAITALVIFQGVVGWWMVQSGLTATDVSPLWLTFHLILGCFTLVYVAIVARSLSTSRLPPAARNIRRFALVILIFAFLQVFYGGLMAGTNAGLTYNTWPLIDGQWIPFRLLFDGFQIGNLVSDIATIQFIHRTNAYILIALVFAHMIQVWQTEFRAPAFALLWLIVIQVVLGILSLMLVLWFPVALFHQAGAVLFVFSTAVYWRGMGTPLPEPEPRAA